MGTRGNLKQYLFYLHPEADSDLIPMVEKAAAAHRMSEEIRNLLRAGMRAQAYAPQPSFAYPQVINQPALPEQPTEVKSIKSVKANMRKAFG